MEILLIIIEKFSWFLPLFIGALLGYIFTRLERKRGEKKLIVEIQHAIKNEIEINTKIVRAKIALAKHHLKVWEHSHEQKREHEFRNVDLYDCVNVCYDGLKSELWKAFDLVTCQNIHLVYQFKINYENRFKSLQANYNHAKSLALNSNNQYEYMNKWFSNELSYLINDGELLINAYKSIFGKIIYDFMNFDNIILKETIKGEIVGKSLSALVLEEEKN